MMTSCLHAAESVHALKKGRTRLRGVKSHHSSHNPANCHQCATKYAFFLKSPVYSVLTLRSDYSFFEARQWSGQQFRISDFLQRLESCVRPGKWRAKSSRRKNHKKCSRFVLVCLSLQIWLVTSLWVTKGFKICPDLHLQETEFTSCIFQSQTIVYSFLCGISW